MDELFDDNKLNHCANCIFDKIEEVMLPVIEGAPMMIFNENGLQVAKELLDYCLDNLNIIKQKTGSSNNNYIIISDSIALTTSAIIKMPVSSISFIANTKEFRSNGNLVFQVKEDLAEATRLMDIISSLDLSSRARQKINENLARLNEAKNRVSPKYETNNRANLKSKGCYIATICYEDRNAIEVQILKEFRDNRLSKTLAGRSFIYCYYSVSPYIAKKLVNTKRLNKFIKVFILDKIVRAIKRYRL